MSALEYLHLRPRFAFDYQENKEEVLQGLKEHFQENKECIGRVTYDQVKIDIITEEQHYWTPQMTFSVEEDQGKPNQCHISGLIGPRPAVWTMFMFFYFLIGLIGAFLSLYGLSQWTLGDENYPLIWAFPLALILIGTGYFVSKAGEKMGHDQIITLKEYLKKGLGPNFDEKVIAS